MKPLKMSTITLAASAALLACSTVTLAQHAPSLAQSWDQTIPYIRDAPDGGIFVGNIHFDSWTDYALSDLFKQNNLRCLTSYDPNFMDPQGPADCSYNNTDPKNQYDPSVAYYRIPVVFHVIRADNGTTGDVSEALINSQIDILNEDFQALPGSNGENGTDIQIEFYLANIDPNGGSTNGITYSNNTSWYNDTGGYYNSLAWDTNRYLNIYTNTASGALGYVPWLPQNGNVGSNADRVVILWSTVGLNSPYGFPYNLGRTTTHELGHYLGLFHTFDGGCATACSTAGDRICDTNPEQNPHFGCNARSTCGNLDPIANYMDYSDDRCMDNFTHDQARRIRCTLENYRPAVYSVGHGFPLLLKVDPLIAGQSSRFTVQGGTTGEKVAILYGTKAGQSSFQNMAGWCATFNIDIPANQVQSRVVAQGTFNSAGAYAVFITAPPNTKGQTFLFQAAQRNTCPDEKMSDVVQQTVQ